MQHTHVKQWIAVLLVLCLVLPYLPLTAAATEPETAPQTWIAEGADLEDASVQLGERTEPAARETASPEALPQEEAAPEPQPELQAQPERTRTAPRADLPTYLAEDTVLDVDGTRFILIGSRQQLLALDDPSVIVGHDASSALTAARRYDVTGPIWRIKETRRTLVSTWVPAEDPEAELVYPGDANLVGEFADYPLYGVNGKITVPAGVNKPGNGESLNSVEDIDNNTRYRYVGGTLNQYDASVTGYSYGKYTLTGSYLVIRDIPLAATDAWTPLMFYGLMFGVQANALGETSLADAVRAIRTSRRSDQYTETEAGDPWIQQPTISNINVNTSGSLYTDEHIGVGFFASVSSNRPGSDLNAAIIQAQVRNLRLENVRIHNGYDTIHVDQTLVNLLTGAVSKLLGVLLDRLLPLILRGSTMTFTNFAESLGDLLVARQRDITNLATGGFAGRIEGDVLVEHCEVENVQVTGGYGYTGGFVGYCTGQAQYLPVTGPLLSLLEGLLNLVPGLGLGDLITVVSQVLRVNDLIPMDYLNPAVMDCTVADLRGSIGPACADPDQADWSYTMRSDIANLPVDRGTISFNGGFVGCKIATMMVNCAVEDSTYGVYAGNYAGGFAGVARDAVIPTLLSGLGIDVFTSANANLQSVQVRCNLVNDNITVMGDRYVGGFNGAMTNAFCVNNEVNCPGNTLLVEGSEDVGGFVGIATLGWAMNLGGQDGREDLLSTVKHLLNTLLGGNYDSSLLSLLGVGKSYILGLQFDYSASDAEGAPNGEVTVKGDRSVGGLVGRGDALTMGGTTADSLNEISYFEHGDLYAWHAFPGEAIPETFTVTYEVMEGGALAEGASAEVSVDPDNNRITLPSATAPAGYTFEGWVLADYDFVDARPGKVYAAGDQVTVIRDLAFRALFSKPGAEAYELVFEEPESARDWGGDYVFTYGTSGDMYVLAGLPNGAKYAQSAEGTKSLPDAGIQVHETHKNFLVGVTDNYVFTATKAALSVQDYYFQNKGTGTYFRLERENNGTILNPDYHPYLKAGDRDTSVAQWSLGIRTTLPDDDTNTDLYSLILQSDTANYKDHYLAFDTELHRFTVAQTSSANPTVRNIYLWRKSNLPPTYTTVAEGEGTGEGEVNVNAFEAGIFSHVNVKGLKSVTGEKYVGGLVGLADTASVSSLIGDTVSAGKFEKFTFFEIYAEGSKADGLTVTATDYYAGGAIGLAIGGDVIPDKNSNETNGVYKDGPEDYGIKLDELKAVQAMNCAGGFAGCVGPGEVLGAGGLNVQLLGLSLIKASNLLSLGQGMATRLESSTVTGAEGGYTVRATGSVAANGLATYAAGGFLGRSNSTEVVDCHAYKLAWVQANLTEGRAGGFLGVSQVGGLASMDDAEGTEIKGLLQANNLLGAVKYLIPTYTRVDTTYVDGGYVKAACAGGFAGEFESGTVDNSTKPEKDGKADPYSVYNVDYVEGSLYAGGFGGRIYSGALADAGGGISILGGIGAELSASNLASLVEVYIPKIICAGVNSESTGGDPEDPQAPGFLVRVTGMGEDKHSGAAGGFVGYASGAQISRCDVRQLRHTEVTPPTDQAGNAVLDGKNGSAYYQSSYAVTGTRYAGGYAGFLDIGSTASLGGGLNALNAINVSNILQAVNTVVSTVEHSTVYGGPGGFAVLATENLGGQEGEAQDPVTVYVVDQKNSADFYAYVYKQGGGDDGTAFPGHLLTRLGTDREGHPYYSLTVDRAQYDRVIFSGPDWQNNDHYNLQFTAPEDPNQANERLGDVSGSRIALYNNPDGQIAQGSDIWPDAYETLDSCRGTYNRYTGIFGTISDVETVSEELSSKQHKYSDWLPNEGVNTHYRACTLCGYSELENCTLVNGYCTVCGRLDANDPGNISEGSGMVGRAGGFVGWDRGAHVQNTHADNFSYIIGEIAAGGYAGEIEPGSVADVLGDTEVLGGLLQADAGLLSLAQDFVPYINNSTTAAIPCGGVVRANAFSDAETQRGMAGGYVGHNLGGQIRGLDTSDWKGEAYPSPIHECKALRILSVYGAEYAGGFTGLMEAGSTAGTGNISLLFGLVKANNLLNALRVSYPNERNTAVYGPLEGLDAKTWNAWIQWVGAKGGYALGMEAVAADTDEEGMKEVLSKYIYGFHVTAGRDTYVQDARLSPAGCAGGYVGSMRSGTVTNGQAYDVKQVKAMRAAGGFAGDMKTGSVANLGQAGVLDLSLDLSGLLQNAVNVFVPVVKTSSVHGYQNGMTVTALGYADDETTVETNGTGNAGGYAGFARGAQIWGDDDDASNPAKGQGCNVYNLKKVSGVGHVGGYIGTLGSGSTAEVGTQISQGPLQDILDFLVSSRATDLLSLVNATVSTVRKAEITVADPLWGFTVEGVGDELPRSAGGFVGTMEGAILGNDQEKTLTAENLVVNDLRGVEALYYAGGFFGNASMGSAASTNNGTNLLSFIGLDAVNLVDIFRPYIFNATVNGVAEGFTVRAIEGQKSGIMGSTRYSGCAGGFGGGLFDGTVKNAKVTNLSQVQAPNYAGGFIGHAGKGGLADVDSAKVGDLLGLNAAIGSAMGSFIKKSSVSGIEMGFIVSATGGKEPVAGGFLGFSDLTKVGTKTILDDSSETEESLACAVSGLKLVRSDQIAGGFVGKTVKGYLVELQASSPVVNLLLQVVDVLVRALYLPELQQADLLNLDLPGGVLDLELLNDGKLIGLKLLGIPITVSVATAENEDGNTDTARITIGDSVIELPCSEAGITDLEQSNLTIRLLPLPEFYTYINNGTVTGISDGFDVFAGGADQNQDGSHPKGAAGGFAGWNNLGAITGCKTVSCDVVRGTLADPGLVGPFTGFYHNDSNYAASSQGEKETDDTCNGTAHTAADLSAPAAKVTLMEDKALLPNPQTMNVETPEMQNPCVETVDLTLYKVWDDLDGFSDSFNEAARPAVTFHIYQLADGVAVSDQPYRTVTLTAADASRWSDNVWSVIVAGLPAAELAPTQSPGAPPQVLHHYTYLVREADSGDSITGVSYADSLRTVEGGKTWDHLVFDPAADTGYAVKIVNQRTLDQIIVVDYGLDVPISVTRFYKTLYDFTGTELELVSLGVVNADGSLPWDSIYALGETAQALPSAQSSPQAAQTLAYGTAVLRAEGGEQKLLYTPDTIQMTGPEKVAVALRRTVNGQSTYLYGTVTILPATVMYYEDSFIKPSDNRWTSAGTALDRDQQEDRPGMDNLDADANNVYGFDHAYDDSIAYSLGSSLKVHVDADSKDHENGWPSASFTFTGTGFDLISVNSGDGGFMTVEITDASSGARIKSWAVDTYYGVSRQRAGFVRYLCVWDGEKWHAVKTVDEALQTAPAVGSTDQGYLVAENFPDPADADHSPRVVYRENYKWSVTSGDTLYQIPVITSGTLEYGTYNVKITAMYAPFFDHVKDGGYDLYLDGVRIYRPVKEAEGENDPDLDGTYYSMDHEAWPQFMEIRRLLLDQGSFDPQEGGQKGVIFMDGLETGAAGGSLASYSNYGPNNEVYLLDGQAVAFALSCEDWEKVDSIQVSAKQVYGDGQTPAKLLVKTGENAQPVLDITSSTECYFRVENLIHWTEGKSEIILLQNVGDTGTIISLRNLKVTYTSKPTHRAEVYVDKDSPAAARALRRAVVLDPAVLDETPGFTAAALRLEADLGLTFYVPLSLLENAANPHVLFVKHTAEGDFTTSEYLYETTEINGVPAAAFTFRGIAAKEMGDTVTARLFYNLDGVDHMTEPMDYSVKRYVMDQLAAAGDETFKTLLVDTLNYGAQAQAYFGYRADEPVNGELTPAQLALGTQADPALTSDYAYVPRYQAGAVLTGCTLSLADRITLGFRFRLKDPALSPERLYLRLTYTDEAGNLHTEELDGAWFTPLEEADGLYAAEFSGLDAAQTRTVLTAELRARSTDLPVSGMLRYSPASYAADMAGSENAGLAELVRALVRYGDAAAAYQRNH